LYTQIEELIGLRLQGEERPRPLCVDLDGTLLKSDALIDGLFTLLRRDPIKLVELVQTLKFGKAKFKSEVTQHVILNPATLPYNREVLEYLRFERDTGRDIYLATAANEAQATAIATHLGIFTGVFASDDVKNLSREAKLRVLEDEFGPEGFDYIGNAFADEPILKRSKVALLANPSPGLAAKLKREHKEIHRTFVDRKPQLRSWLNAIRVRQWPKNFLIFLPLFLAHLQTQSHKLLAAAMAFAAFCLVASATYIFNDLLDLEADRSHPKKRNRPFAQGDLSAGAGLGAMLLMLVVAILLAVALPRVFGFWLTVYFATTIAYSLKLKKVALLDAITLAGLYTVRLVAGGAATKVMLSPWLGGFSLFFFLSLAMVKRYAELHNLNIANRVPANERGYFVADLELLRSLGTASGFASVVIFALYINNPEITHLYGHPQRLWLLSVVLVYWISRIWLLAHRGELDEDPVVFALSDRVSLLMGVIAALIVMAAV
jgi:4-hydroxybenzoate polyprenyltransferase/phosphoserine phosphatase